MLRERIIQTQACFPLPCHSSAGCQCPGKYEHKRGLFSPIPWRLPLAPQPAACVWISRGTCVNARPWGSTATQKAGCGLWPVFFPQPHPRQVWCKEKIQEAFLLPSVTFQNLNLSLQNPPGRNRQCSFSRPPSCKILAQGLTRECRGPPVYQLTYTLPRWAHSLAKGLGPGVITCPSGS